MCDATCCPEAFPYEADVLYFRPWFLALNRALLWLRVRIDPNSAWGIAVHGWLFDTLSPWSSYVKREMVDSTDRTPGGGIVLVSERGK